MRINEVFDKFNTGNTLIRVEICDYGHINDTYIVYTDTSKRYVLQRINQNVFNRIDLLMSNIESVIEHVRVKVKRRHGEDRECLNLIPTKDDNTFCWHCDDNSFWRLYDYIEDTVMLNKIESSDTLYEVGKAFGQFQKDLSDFNVARLHDTLPNFHDTPKRLLAFNNACKEDVCGRLAEIKDEVEFVKNNKSIAGLVVGAMRRKQIPVRVTHNDTKLNNILMDDKTLKAVCVIDLDTVMRGAGVYDFGDCVRSCCNTLPKDETDITKVGFAFDSFEALARGFIGAVGKEYKKAERDLMAPSCLIMAYELAARYLTDYLSGDVYFKTKYKEHNLDRARIQIKLFEEMNKARSDMDNTINTLFKKV